MASYILFYFMKILVTLFDFSHMIHCKLNFFGGLQMSDLAATNCGNGCGRNNDCCSIIWIILLLSCFCGNGNGTGFGFGNNCGDGCGNNSCLWIILLLLFCGNGNSVFGGNNGCGCNFGCGC